MSGCATAHNYLEPDQPLYQGLFAPPVADRPIPGTIRVVTYNIEVGAHVEEATEVLRSRAELRQADVFLLQEMDEPGVRAIAEALSLGYVYAPSSHHTKQGRDIGANFCYDTHAQLRWFAEQSGISAGCRRSHVSSGLGANFWKQWWQCNVGRVLSIRGHGV